MVPASSARPLPVWGRRLLVATLIILLASVGMFEEAVFAALGQWWHPGTAAAAAAVSGLTTHGLPVAISYRLLYAALNVALLHVLLHGRCTAAAGLAYAAGYAVSVGLLLLGRQAGLPAAATTAHRLLDLLSSPLPVLLAYPLAMRGRSWRVRPGRDEG